jgi:hypothetical protein
VTYRNNVLKGECSKISAIECRAIPAAHQETSLMFYPFP